MEQRDDVRAFMRLQAHGFDLMAQVEAFLRYVREVQQHLATLKDDGSSTRRAQALHSIRRTASMLLRDCDPFCVNAREVHEIIESLTPERRSERRTVAMDRRRRA